MLGTVFGRVAWVVALSILAVASPAHATWLGSIKITVDNPPDNPMDAEEILYDVSFSLARGTISSAVSHIQSDTTLFACSPGSPAAYAVSSRVSTWSPAKATTNDVLDVQFADDGTYRIKLPLDQIAASTATVHDYSTDCNGGSYDHTTIDPSSTGGGVVQSFFWLFDFLTPAQQGTASEGTLSGTWDTDYPNDPGWHLHVTWNLQFDDACLGSHRTNLHEGDKVTVTVRVNAPPGAALELDSAQTGQPIQQPIPASGKSVQFTYTKNTPGDDHIVPRWVGATDGTESCAMTVSTSACKSGKTGTCASPYTYEAKAQASALVYSSSLMAALGVASIGACAACAANPECLVADPEIASTVCGGATGVLVKNGTSVADYVSYAIHEAEVADDPPDPNYTEIVTPIIPAPTPGFPIATDAVLSAEVLQSLNDMVSLGAELAAYSVAAQRTIQKLSGAYRANDTGWQGQQAVVLSAYERHIADLLPAYVNTLADFRAGLGAFVTTPFPITATDIAVARGQLARQGLGPGITQQLLDLGATQSAIDRQVAAIIDSAPAPAEFPDVIANQGEVDAMLAFAAHLTAPGSLMCYKVRQTSTTPTSPPFTLADSFDVASFLVSKSSMVCNVAGADNVDDQLLAPFDDFRHLEAVRAKRAPGSPPSVGLGTTHLVSNAYQSGVHMTLKKESHVLLASGASLGTDGTVSPSPSALDNFKCFKVTSSDAPKLITGNGIFSDVRDQVTEQALVVGKPRYLCAPATVGGTDVVTRVGALICYATKPCVTCAKRSILPTDVMQSVSNDVTGDAVVRVRRAAELCVPSVLDPPVTQ